MLKHDLSMGHGNADAIGHYYFKSTGEGAAGKTATAPHVLDEIYAGPRAGLRPIHEKLMAAVTKFGPFETAPKGYVSLRRKQFAMIGPATKTRVELGLNMKGIPATSRLAEMPAGGMCQYKVKITDAKEVDAELIAWIRQAYDSAG